MMAFKTKQMQTTWRGLAQICGIYTTTRPERLTRAQWYSTSGFFQFLLEHCCSSQAFTLSV